ncbi:MAG: putative alpha-1,2-mannosidase [Polyangiales bacterium]
MPRFHLLCLVFICACSSPSGVDAGTPGADVGLDASDAGSSQDAQDVGAVPDVGPLAPSRAASTPLTQWVDPAIGTGGLGYGVGSASIAPQRPFGMIRPGPDTGSATTNGPNFNHCSGYYAGDSHIWGFSQMRMHGTGIVDYGHIALMPMDGFAASETTNQGYASAFDKSSEQAEAGYYRVKLSEPSIEAEITAAERVARYRFHFDADADAVVLVDASHMLVSEEFVDGVVRVDAASREVSGYSQIAGGYSGRFGGARVYFVARFDQALNSFGTFEEGTLHEGVTEHVGEGGAYLHFGGAAVEVAVAVSFVDVEHARLNLDAEDAPFDVMREATTAAWESVLSRVLIRGRSDEEFRRFYTALYQSLLMPTLASDVDGSYRGIDNEVHEADFRYSTDFSLWDTFRTQVPLLGLIYPELLQDHLRSLSRMAEDGGYVPRWPLAHGFTGGMVGESANVVFADALIRGVPFDLRGAYDALRRTAFASPEGDAYGGRRDLDGYLERGFVASDAASWAVSATMEFAYNDACLATLADAAAETSDAALLRERAGAWRNVWDDERAFFVGRDRAGGFDPEFREDVWRDYYAEGNARQYLWYVPHDLEGLQAQLGGAGPLRSRLAEFFESSLEHTETLIPSPYYWQGNEPDIHAPWLFSAYGDVDASMRWTRWVAETFYGLGTDGLPGNDDSGTMSAWYVFAALGVYPIAGTETWIYSAPLLTEAVIERSEGSLTISAPEASDRARHLETLVHRLPSGEEREFSAGVFEHADIAAGGALNFALTE